MDLINSTKGDAQAMQALDKAGRPWLTVILKSTYRLGASAGLPARLAVRQNKLLVSDVFEGEPGLSAPHFESDLVPFKARCDVIVKASAHLPWAKGAPATARHVDVGLRVDNAQGHALIDKSIRVFGKRVWHKRGPLWSLSTPEPFASMPLSYSLALGGMHDHSAIGSDNPQDFDAHPMNLVGRGYASAKFSKAVQGAPAHQIEAWVQGKLKSIGDPHVQELPAALGPVARNWQPRLAFAGTYDDAWRDEVFPLLPDDFDERFYQCAPLDQQMPYPQGGEQIRLLNLSLTAAQDENARGLLSFKLPNRAMPMVVLTKARQVHALKAVIDTVAIDTDAMTFDITWRARLALQRSLHEVHTVAIGPVSKQWWDGKVAGREHCAGCNEDSALSMDADAALTQA